MVSKSEAAPTSAVLAVRRAKPPLQFALQRTELTPRPSQGKHTNWPCPLSHRIGSRAAGISGQSAEGEPDHPDVWRVSELVAVSERRVGLAMEPRPTEVVTRPTSPYQYPKAILNPAVKDYVVWSLFSFTSCNCCCLGLFALLFSIKVNAVGKDGKRPLIFFSRPL
ncbi:hypothetical protein NXF25_001334 [Crotalus adamanteus]|uniref:Uncharacterized protein n=1 Tax=Crotalus adamanteus TaxID=8729 RepID=A0AAW1C6M2_CROAD